ncbi:hypothetical protein ACRALDRAFT_2028901 [Sodiomyces alcalophilus JCM 7366]|uniref:uncharacterized protein n=1 Tax=Sodiomyces alcalophilus JCM 7366 TaxID=591952 RepID=UPI0039B48ED5
MPIYQVDLEQPEAEVACRPRPCASPQHQPPHHASHLARKLSEESIRTEFCEGPIPDSPRPASPEGCHCHAADSVPVTSDRAELIERLKRGQSPTWSIPYCHLETLFRRRNSSSSPPSRSPPSPSSPRADSPNTLLPPADITPEKAPEPPQSPEVGSSSDDHKRQREGLNIQRPGSALHSGDFTHLESRSDRDPDRDRDRDRDIDIETHQTRDAGYAPPPRPAQPSQPSSSAAASWVATSPPRHFTPFTFDRRPCPPYTDRTDLGADFRSIPSSLSSSYSTGFAYKPPTSPLVQSESNEDLDPPPTRNGNGGADVANARSSPVKNYHRRHTLTSTPSPLNLPSRRSAAFAAGLSAPRREGSTLPYQAHQPRRSLTPATGGGGGGGGQFLGTSSPQTPAILRSRRPSVGGPETFSPLQHASMVGSYEESILRGRMSTTPSKPLDFLAQIGVLGLGKCKPSLKCPSHVTLPFPAVFYSYGSSSGNSYGRAPSEDGPSPYVGQIDLENGLPDQTGENRSRRKMHSRRAVAEEQTSPLDGRETNRGDGDRDRDRDGDRDRDRDRGRDRPNRPRRASGAARAPPGGHYRIPEKGQIQIVIKNPNKTAVKLFLVPYDLAGMEAGTKTFIRQRSYSMGPVIEDAPVSEPATADRPILRYLVHLHICCPAKGRFYLYKNIRIVFANRVPDGKEKLRNETTWPEPRFTAYKPVRVMHPPLSATSATGPGAMLAAETAFRRRSLGVPFGHYARGLDAVDGASPSPQTHHHHHTSSNPFGLGIGNNRPVDPIPLRLPPRRDLGGSDQGDGATASTVAGLRSPTTDSTSSSQASSNGGASRPGTQDGMDRRYEKLSKGDAGYGGNMFTASGLRSPGETEGLLSRRLRSLGVQGLDASYSELGDLWR